MPIDPSAAAEAAAKIAGDELKRERTNWKEFLQYVRNIPKNLIKDTLFLAPRFVLLLIKILKSNEIDSGLKLLFSGMIIVISTLLGFIIWDMSAIVIFAGLMAAFGTITALTAVLLGSAVILIKSALTAVLVLISMFLCNTLFTTEELKELAIDAFGEEEGTSFIEKFNSLIKSTDNGIEKFILPVKNFFIKIGEKKKNKDGNNDFSDLEEKIKSKI